MARVVACRFPICNLSGISIVLGQRNQGIQLMEPEVALYWRIVCMHLQKEAQVSSCNMFISYNLKRESDTELDLKISFVYTEISTVCIDGLNMFL